VETHPLGVSALVRSARHPEGQEVRDGDETARSGPLRRFAKLRADVDWNFANPPLEMTTTTPEDTLRAAGISDKRQARYQRRMSSLLAGRTR